MQKNIDFKKDLFAINCGIHIDEFRPGYAQCSMPVTENHLNGIGILMGGATFTLADFTISVAANSYGAVGVSLNANISFLNPCSLGTVTAIATEVSRSKKIGVYRVSITDDTKQLIAEVTGTCYFKSPRAE